LLAGVFINKEQEGAYIKALEEGETEYAAMHRLEFLNWDPRGWHMESKAEIPFVLCTFCCCPPKECHSTLFGRFYQLHVVHALYKCSHKNDLLNMLRAGDIFCNHYNEVL
jgi:hypothetical protein